VSRWETDRHPESSTTPPMSTLTAAQRAYANELVSFIYSSPTPFHAVAAAKSILLKAGFTELTEREPWGDKVHRGKKYFVSRNGSSLIAFGVGSKWEPGKGIGIVGAHTGISELH
jgi:aspartyl aminopeptidase